MSRQVGSHPAVAGRGIARAVSPVALSGLLLGCFPAVEREYHSNRAVLDDAAAAIGYRVPPETFQLTRLDIRADSVVFHYKGTEYPGDEAWVIRFSEKSSEQNPALLSSAHTMLEVIAEQRESLRPVSDFETHEFAGHTVESVRFRFDSPFRDDDGKPLEGHGIVAVVRVRAGEGDGGGGGDDDDSGNGNVLVYQIKLENHGDRERVSFSDLTPFLESLRRAPRPPWAAGRSRARRSTGEPVIARNKGLAAR